MAAHGVSGLNAVNGKNLNGKGVTIGIGDNADISTHIDFSGRVDCTYSMAARMIMERMCPVQLQVQVSSM